MFKRAILIILLFVPLVLNTAQTAKGKPAPIPPKVKLWNWYHVKLLEKEGWRGTFEEGFYSRGGINEKNFKPQCKAGIVPEGLCDKDKDGKTTWNDIRLITVEENKRYYKKIYWDTCKGDSINSPIVACMVADLYINMGWGANNRQHLRKLHDFLGVKSGYSKKVKLKNGKTSTIFVPTYSSKTLSAINLAKEADLVAHLTKTRVDFYLKWTEKGFNRRFRNGLIKRANYWPQLYKTKQNTFFL